MSSSYFRYFTIYYEYLKKVFKFDMFGVMTGNDLKTKREKMSVSQEKLAQALDLSVSTVSRWEQMKEDEIPNSRMLELSLKGLEKKKV
ncbi:hypothetical protein BH18ACI3_BH18ACI3_20180 [soil metagenome]